MRSAGFSGGGVAVAPLALAVVLGGCSNLTAPPNHHDGGRDLSHDWRAVVEPDTEADGLSDGDPDMTDGQVGDSKQFDKDTGGAGGTGGMGGSGGTGGVTVDGGLTTDGPRLIDSLPGSDAAVVTTDGPRGPDGYTAPDTVGAKDTPSDNDGTTLAVSAGADATACMGSAVTLGAPAQGGTPPYVYAWTATPACSDCIAAPNTAQTTVSPKATTTFTLTVTDSLGDTVSDSAVVTVLNPIADVGTKTVAICHRESVALGTPARAGYTYQWTCDRPTCSMSNANAAQPTVNPSLSTMYTLTATSPEGCVATDSATVWINLPVSTSPTDGATYPRSGSLFAQFGAPVLVSSLSRTTITLREKNSKTPVGFDFGYDTASRILTMTPTGENYDTTIGEYTLILAGGANGILSDDPVRPQRLPDDMVVSYTISGTPDTTRPTIESRSPNSAAINVPINAGVSAVWSEALNPATVNASSFTVSSGMTAVPGTVTYDPKSFTVIFVPNAEWKAMTTYTVGATGIRDVSGNTATTTGWSFTTGSTADSTPPTVTSVTPAAGATKVSVGGLVSVTFSEPVKPVSAMAGIQVTTGTTPVAGSVAYDGATRQAVFTPSGLLDKQTTYTVTVSGVQDYSDNTMGAAFTSTFTTANVLFSDTFESGTSQWTLTSTWGLTAAVAASPTHSLTDSPVGEYGPASSSATSSAIEVAGLSSVNLSYWFAGTLAMYDMLAVEYSTGSVWTAAANLSGSLAKGIRSHNITLAAGATQLQIRFRLLPNPYSYARADGVYIDNVLVQAN